MDYETLVSELRELRRRSEVAESRLLYRIYEIETTPELFRVVKEAGCAGMADFLKSNKLADPGRYERFKAGVANLTADLGKCESMGAEAIIEGARVSAEAVDKYEQGVDCWVAEHHGVKPSPESAERIRRNVDPHETVPQGVRAQSEKAALRAENAKLRARVRELEADVRARDAEIAKLRERPSAEGAVSGERKGGARKPAANAAKSLVA